MNAPIKYYNNTFPVFSLEEVRAEVNWLSVTDARMEAFQCEVPVEYTYGSGRGVRTYRSTPYTPIVWAIQEHLIAIFPEYKPVDVCFLNRYVDDKKALDWHADDSPEVDPEAPIYVVSFGAERFINFRPKGQKGVATGSQLLGNGSLLVMLPGMQQAWEHKIPKHHGPCGERISLTYRRMKQ